MAGGDPVGPLGWPHLPQGGDLPGNGCIQIEYSPLGQPHRSRRGHDLRHRNYGHTMPPEAGTWAAISASPAAPAARTPSGPAGAATPGTPSPASARIRSPAILPAGIAISPCPIRTCCGHNTARTVACTELTQRRAGNPAASRAGPARHNPVSPATRRTHCHKRPHQARRDLASGSPAVHSQHRGHLARQRPPDH